MRLAFLLLALAVAAICGVRAAGKEGAAAPTSSTSTTRKTVSFADTTFTGISVCTPVALLVTESAESPWTVVIEGPADAVAALDLSPTFPGSGSLAIESSRAFTVPASSPLRIEVRVPPKTLQYVERVHAPGDTWVDAEFSAEKAEIAVAAGSGVVLAERMGTGMAKLSLAGAGPAVLAGSGPWWEIFVTGVGSAHGSGATGSVRVKLDEGGKLSLDPAAANVTVDGRVGVGGAGLTLTQGVCYVKDETDGAEHGEEKPYDCSGGKGGPATPPAVVPQWSCGVATGAAWRCGGGGVDGAPSFTATPCTAGRVAAAMERIK